MVVKCLNCETIYERKSEEEKCCEKCACIKECPNCGCSNFEKINQQETKKIEKQILLD
jgi:predicted  nucleic acid-binding Zn-ribbon protein